MKTKILLFAGLLLVVTVTQSHATTYRGNVKGLQGVLVVTEEISPDLEKDGVTQAQLKTRVVELKLRQAGIRVLTEDEWLKTPGCPWLYLMINSVHGASAWVYATYVRLELRENVKLVRDGSMAVSSAVTWQKGYGGLIGTARLRGIYETADNLTDEFVNDFLAANPK